MVIFATSECTSPASLDATHLNWYELSVKDVWLLPLMSISVKLVHCVSWNPFPSQRYSTWPSYEEASQLSVRGVLLAFLIKLEGDVMIRGGSAT